jgi:molybdate/tungstate transport system substrate-binding protein
VGVFLTRRAVILVLVLAVGAACGTASPGTKGSTGKSQTVSVAYAGSLLYLMEKVVGPAFTAETGYGYSGRGAGSLALSKEIAAGEITPDVFLSIGSKPIKSLEPKFTSWYVQVAASPIVIAYSRTSRFASQLAAIAAHRRPVTDLFRLLATKGFRLGRTDPNVDPQGQAFIEMLQLAKRRFGLPPGEIEQILGGPPRTSNAASPEIFEETALEPRLEAGQLDAASAFLSQAIELHLPYIDLGPALDLGDPALADVYKRASIPLSTGEIVHGKPLVVDVAEIGTTHAAAARAFIAYLLSPAGRAAFARNGYRLLPAKAFGNLAAVPAAVKGELAR